MIAEPDVAPLRCGDRTISSESKCCASVSRSWGQLHLCPPPVLAPLFFGPDLQHDARRIGGRYGLRECGESEVPPHSFPTGVAGVGSEVGVGDGWT